MIFSAADLAPYAVIYSVTFTKGSPRAVEISAMDFSVRLGKPEVHRDMAASDRPFCGQGLSVSGSSA